MVTGPKRKATRPKRKPPTRSGDCKKPKVKADVLFDLNSVLQHDASEIIAARTLGKVAHRTKDIDTAGSEVEEAVRAVFAKKLPRSVVVEHGHLVDVKLSVSSQIDVAIVDPTDLVGLMRAKDGTCYIPYECVYAIGEIKTTFTKKHVLGFSDKLASLRTLERAQNTQQPSSRQHYQYGNPLYSFMLFVESKDDPLALLKEIVVELTSADRPLPNAICILDRGLVLNCTFIQKPSEHERLGNINVMPEFAREVNRAWCLLPFGSEEFREGANLGVLVALLIEHINSCMLQQPDLLRYMRALFLNQAYQRLDR